MPIRSSPLPKADVAPLFCDDLTQQAGVGLDVMMCRLMKVMNIETAIVSKCR